MKLGSAMGRLAAVGAVVLGCSGVAQATNFSFTGDFVRDDEVQLFNFTVGASSSVTLRAWSYAGGVNAQGQTIARGGFDTILALFDSTGALIDQNDDGGCGNVAADALTGNCWDTYLQATLGAGIYSVAIMQYDNFAAGGNLSDGFTRQGQGNFTTTGGGFICADDPNNASPFHDVSGVSPGCLRDGHWAFDILNVNDAVVVAAPEPASLAILGLGLGALGFASRRRRRAN